jgi:hypothetical protein
MDREADFWEYLAWIRAHLPSICIADDALPKMTNPSPEREFQSRIGLAPSISCYHRWRPISGYLGEIAGSSNAAPGRSTVLPFRRHHLAPKSKPVILKDPVRTIYAFAARTQAR